MVTDSAVPVLPCRSLVLALGFYARLGFRVRKNQGSPDAYAVIERGTLELHFFEMKWLEPDESYAGCYLRVSDIDALHAAFSAAHDLTDFGIPRLSGIEQKPWGMREFHLVDPDGNLLRVGQASPVATHSPAETPDSSLEGGGAPAPEGVGSLEGGGAPAPEGVGSLEGGGAPAPEGVLPSPQS